MSEQRNPVPVADRVNILVRFVRTLQLGWRLFKDSRVPLFPKLIVPIATILIISPIDLMNFVPVLGEIDDVALFFLSTMLFIKLCPDEVVEEHRHAIENPLPKNPRPKENVIEGSYRVMKDDH